MEQIITEILLADRIWIAVAMLHQQMPEREGFTKDEIRQKLRESGLMDGLKPGSVAAHLKEHMVANVPTTSTKYRMLHKTDRDQLRLFRLGDPVDPSRHSRHPQRDSRPPLKSKPRREEIPLQFLHLLDWYEEWNQAASGETKPNWEDDPLIRLIGSGKHIWADEHADEYVENLRKEEI
jgi:hypothetical protein